MNHSSDITETDKDRYIKIQMFTDMISLFEYGAVWIESIWILKDYCNLIFQNVSSCTSLTISFFLDNRWVCTDFILYMLVAVNSRLCFMELQG